METIVSLDFLKEVAKQTLEFQADFTPFTIEPKRVIDKKVERGQYTVDPSKRVWDEYGCRVYVDFRWGENCDEYSNKE